MKLQLEELESRLVPNTYWLSPTGNDNNSGSQTAPWATLQHAANTIQTGDLVEVETGSYAGFSLSKSGVDFEGYNPLHLSTGWQPHVPWIQIVGASNVKIGQLLVLNSTADGIDLINTYRIHLNGLLVARCQGVGIHLENANETILINDIVGNCEQGIVSDSASKDVFISEVKLEGNKHQGAVLSGTNVVFAQSFVRCNAGDGVDVVNAPGARLLNDEWCNTFGHAALCVDNSPGTDVINCTIVALADGGRRQIDPNPQAFMVENSANVCMANSILISNVTIAADAFSKATLMLDCDFRGNAAAQSQVFQLKNQTGDGPQYGETNSQFPNLRTSPTGAGAGTADASIMPKDDIAGNLRTTADMGAWQAAPARGVGTTYPPPNGFKNNDLPFWF